MIVSLVLLVNLLHYMPYESRSINNLEVFNELTVLSVITLLLCFGDFVPDAKTRYETGYAYIGVTLVNIFINLIIMLASLFR